MEAPTASGSTAEVIIKEEPPQTLAHTILKKFVFMTALTTAFFKFFLKTTRVFALRNICKIRSFILCLDHVLYRPGENLFEGFKPGKFITVYILASHLLQNSYRQVWGTDIYTDDSDIIAGLLIRFVIHHNLICCSLSTYWKIRHEKSVRKSSLFKRHIGQSKD